VRVAETRTAGSGEQPTAGAGAAAGAGAGAGAGPAVEPAPPAPEPALHEAETADDQATEPSDQDELRTRTENPHLPDGEDSSEDDDSEAPNTHDGDIRAADVPDTAADLIAPAVQIRTPESVPADWDRTYSTAGATAAAPQPRQDWMAPVFQLADEVKNRGVAKTKSIDTVASVITAIDAGAKNNAISTDTGLSHHTVAKIREAVAEIRYEHSGNGRVIELRKGGN
jgi:hypothetical protein